MLFVARHFLAAMSHDLPDRIGRCRDANALGLFEVFVEFHAFAHDSLLG
jgi:hypothetical protein